MSVWQWIGVGLFVYLGILLVYTTMRIVQEFAKPIEEVYDEDEE